MPPEVVFEMALGNKFLAADLALVVSAASMGLHMHIQVSLLSEVVAANFAGERLDAEVFAQVDF